MTELMKQYEKKVGQPVNWIKNPKGYTDYVTSLLEMSEIHNAVLKDENERLRDQLTWRPVTQKPKEGQIVFAMTLTGWVVSQYLNGEFYVDDGFTFGDLVEGVIRWLPIPPVQEGK